MNCAEPFRCGGVITAVCCAVCPPFRIFRNATGPVLDSPRASLAADDTDADCLRKEATSTRCTSNRSGPWHSARTSHHRDARAHLCLVAEYFFSEEFLGGTRFSDVFTKETRLSILLMELYLIYLEDRGEILRNRSEKIIRKFIIIPYNPDEN